MLDFQFFFSHAILSPNKTRHTQHMLMLLYLWQVSFNYPFKTNNNSLRRWKRHALSASAALCIYALTHTDIDVH